MGTYADKVFEKIDRKASSGIGIGTYADRVFKKLDLETNKKQQNNLQTVQRPNSDFHRTNREKYGESAEYYTQFKNSTDFNEKAKQGLAIKKPEYNDTSKKNFFDTLISDYDPITYSNGNSGMLTAEEQNIYGYLASTQGEKKANQYLDTLYSQMNERRGEKLESQAKKMADEHPILSSALTVPANIAGAPFAVIQASADAIKDITDGTNTKSDPYKGAYMVNNYSNKIRETVSNNIRKDSGSEVEGNIKSFLYETGMSMADFLAALAVTGGKSAANMTLMGTKSWADTAISTMKKGGTPVQALMNGMFAGAAEAAFEKIPLDNLFSIIGKSGKEAANKTIVRAMLSQGMSEFGEEACTEIANTITDYLVMGDLSDYNLSVKAYTEQGLSESEAKRRATMDVVSNVLVSGMGGFVSGAAIGGASSSINSAINYAYNKASEKSADQNAINLGTTEAFRNPIAQDIDGNYVSVNNKKSINQDNNTFPINAPKTTQNQGKAQYSIQADSNGKKYVNVDTDQHIFEGVEPKEYHKIARKYILENFRGKIIGENESRAFVNKRSAEEYAYPANKRQESDIKSAKMKSSTELDNLMSTSQFVEHTDDDGRHPDATGGWDWYSVDFVVDGQPFSGTISVKNTDNGRVFYDMTKIRSLNDRKSDLSGKPLHVASVDKTSINSTIPQEQSGVNTSIRENAENMTQNRQIRVSEEEVQALASAAEKAGVKVELKDLGRFNGKYKDGVIYISPYSKKPALQVFKHELTHHLESSNYYPSLEKYVLRKLTKIYGKEYMSTMVNSTMSEYSKNGIELSESEARREIVADFVADELFQSEKSVQDLVQSDRSLGEQILNWIKYKIKQFSSGDPNERFLMKAERMYEKALKSVDKRAGIEGKEKNRTQYSLGYTTDNKPVVVVENDILKGIPQSQWIQTVKDTISEKFSDGIPISGRLIKVNQKTRNEYTNSKNSQWYSNNNQIIYADKFRSANNLDDIVLASTNYINEDLKHKRNDKFTEFARGDVLIRVGDADYSAKVIVGFTSGKQMVLYDVIDFSPTSLKLKKTDMRSPSNRNKAENGSNISVPDITVPQKAQSVNTSISDLQKNDTGEAKFSLSDASELSQEPEYMQEYESKLSEKNSKAASPLDNPETNKLINDPDAPTFGKRSGFTKSFALRIKNASLQGIKDIWRAMDSFAGQDAELRKYLDEKILKPLEKAKARYAFTSRDKARQFKSDMDRFGIKAGSQESAAIMWIGEGKKQIGVKKNENGFIEAKTTPYTLEMLKKDFPNTWENILKAEKLMRSMYNDYVARINEMLEKVYPNAGEAALKKLENRKKSLAYAEKRAIVSRSLRDTLPIKIKEKELQLSKNRKLIKSGKEQIFSKKPLTFQEHEKLEARVSSLKEKLEKVNKYLETSDDRIATAKEKLAEQQKIIDNNEHLKNKRLIPRKDYFYHMQEMETGFSALKNIIGGNFEIDPALVSISEDTKPKSKWTSFMQHRGNGKYLEDAVTGMVEYMKLAEAKIEIDPVAAYYRDVVADVANQTQQSKNANAFIDYMTQYTNGLLGKTNRVDRLIQNETGRKAMKIVTWITNRVKANAVVGNLSSAISQFFNYQNVAGYIKNPVDLAVGEAQHLRYFAQSLLNKKNVQDNEIALLLDSSPFLTERYLSNEFDAFDKSKFKTVHKFTSALLEFGDKWVAQSGWLAAYRQGLRKNMPDPVAYADNIIRRAVGGRGVGELSLHQQSIMVKTFAPFTVEVWNSWNMMVEQTKNKDFAGLIITMVVAFFMNSITKALFGKTPSADPIGAVKDGMTQALDPKNDKNAFEKTLGVAGRLSGELLQNMPYANFILPILIADEDSREDIFGESDPSRYGTGNIGLNMVTQPIADLASGNNVSLLEPALNIVLPGGGAQAYRTYQAAIDLGLPYLKVNASDGISLDQRAFPSSVTDKGRYRFSIDTSDPLDVASALAFGSYSTKGGKAYLESGAKSLSKEATQKMIEANEDGTLSSAQFIQYYAFKQTAKADKDKNGKSIPGSLKKKKIDFLVKTFGFSKKQAENTIKNIG